jgi:hypothetical protein
MPEAGPRFQDISTDHAPAFFITAGAEITILVNSQARFPAWTIVCLLSSGGLNSPQPLPEKVRDRVHHCLLFVFAQLRENR